MKKLLAVFLLMIAFVLCFFSGFVVSANRNAADICELLEENIKLQTTVNVYLHNYGPLTEMDAKKFLGKEKQALSTKNIGLLGPI